jgi:hypothetical protein
MGEKWLCVWKVIRNKCCMHNAWKNRRLFKCYNKRYMNLPIGFEKLVSHRWMQNIHKFNDHVFFIFSANCETPDSRGYTWTSTCPSNIGYKMDIFCIRTVQFEQSTWSLQRWVQSSQYWYLSIVWSTYFTQLTRKESSCPQNKSVFHYKNHLFSAVCGYNHCLFWDWTNTYIRTRCE